MAKDGTNRGGRRVRAGDKTLSAVEKIQKGQSVKIIDNDLPTLTPSELDSVDLPEGAVLEGLDMPKPVNTCQQDRKTENLWALMRFSKRLGYGSRSAAVNDWLTRDSSKHTRRHLPDTFNARRQPAPTDF